MNNGKAHILLVEDSVSFIQYVSEVLKMQDFRLTAADCLKDATILLGKNKFDLILLDVVLPDGNGYDFCTTLKQQSRYADMPVIFISIKNDTESIIKGLSVGAADFITKPFNAQELILRVNIHVQQMFIKKQLRKQVWQSVEKELTAIENQTLLYNVLNNNNEGICLFDKNHLCLLFNKAMSDITGFSHKEVTQSTFFWGLIVHDIEQQQHISTLLQNLSPHQPKLQTTIKIISKNNQTKEVNITLLRLIIEHEQYYMCIVDDTTETATIKMELDEHLNMFVQNEYFYQSILSDIPSPVIVTGTDGTILFASDRVINFLETSETELLNNNICNLINIPPDIFTQTIQDERFSFDVNINTPSGNNVINISVSNHQNNKENLVFTLQNITELHQNKIDIAAQQREKVLFTDALRQLQRINMMPKGDIKKLYKEFLTIGNQIFGTTTGIISHIENDLYHIVATQTNLTFQPNDVFNLADTYCVMVVKNNATQAYHQVGVMSDVCKHPVYQNFKLETYIGSPIWVFGKIYGTLNFSSTNIKTAPFSALEIEFNELMAKSLGQIIELENTEQLRQRTQLALQQSERELSNLVSSIEDIIFQFDDQYRFAKMFANNDAFLFVPRHQIIGNTIRQVLGNEFANQIEPIIDNVVATQQKQEIEYSSPDGTQWFNARFTYTGQQENKRHLVSVLIRNITDSKNIEQKIKNILNEQKIVLDNIDSGIIYQQNNQILWQNDALERLFLFDADPKSKEKLVQRLEILIKNPDTKQKLLSGQIYSSERLFKRGNDDIFWCKISCKMLNSQAQQPDLIWFFEDVSDRKQVQEQQIITRKKFEFLSESASILISMENESQIFRYTAETLHKMLDNIIVSIATVKNNVNSTIYHIQGISPNQTEMIEKLFSVDISKIQYTINAQYFNKLCKGKPILLEQSLAENIETSYTKQFRAILQSQTVYAIGIARNEQLFGIATIYIPDADYKPDFGFVETFLYQVSVALHRKQLQNELLEQKERAEKANKAKSAFLASMSHEIRTPLNAVLGFADLMVRNETDQIKQSYLQSIQSSGKTLLNLINDILDLSKIEADKMPLVLSEVNISTVVKDIQHIFSLQAQQKGIQLTCKNNISEQFFLLDDLRLRQVLINLMSNALKFTEKGYVNLTADIQHVDDTINLIISVQDTGIGIAPEWQTAIFDAFQQYDQNDNRKYGGTGLGLAITKRLVQLMNGSITLQSKLKEGSTFTISLFNIKPVRSNILITNKNKQENVLFDKATVLIADDVQNNRILLESYLSESPVNIIHASNGNDAVKLAILHKPNLILLDLTMPIMDGWTAAKHLKKNNNTRAIPIIAITASIFSDRKKEMETLFDAVLYKPVNYEEFINNISRFLTYQSITISGKLPINASTTAVSDDLKLLINNIVKQYMQLYETTGDTEPIRELSVQLGIFAQNYNIKNLQTQSIQLNQYVEKFDIAGMEQLIAEIKLQFS